MGELNIFSSFFEKKSIANSQNFSVSLSFTKGVPRSSLMSKYLSHIHPHHIVGVNIPLNKFERVTTSTGMMEYSYPVLTSQQGIDVTLTFEEDQRGTIAGFIQALQRMVFRDGANVAPFKSILGDIIVIIYDTTLSPISQYVYHDVFFLGATAGSLSYSSSQAMTYDLTFGSSYMKFVEHIPNPQLDTAIDSSSNTDTTELQLRSLLDDSEYSDSSSIRLAEEQQKLKRY